MGKAIRAYFKGDCPAGERFNGIPVQDKENPGNSYVTWDSGWEIPAGIFSRFTVWDIWPAENIRELGVYNHKSARAELDKSVNGGISCYTLAMSGTELNDLLELNRMIRAGKIRPTESWEAQQIPSDLDTLNEEIEKLGVEVRNMIKERDRLLAENAILTAQKHDLEFTVADLRIDAALIRRLLGLPWYKQLGYIREIRLRHHETPPTLPPAAT